MISPIDSQATRITTESGQEDGLLLFHDGSLVAVISHLRHSVTDEFAGRWFVEAGFGPCARGGSRMFDTAEDAQRWVRRCLEEDMTDHERAAA
ncbi:hypothetical protein [Methylobacterium oryzisoli]|uniref:hypothetical protein n=1 Tax=Methylobacterium oryzisoli TaxID=3385502 RepID=UPI0038916A08